MMVALSGASAPTLPLDEELALATAAGYTAVELWLPKVWPDLERRGPEGLAPLLARHRLTAVALAPITEATFRDAAGRDRLTAEVHGAAALARGLRASWLVIQPGEQPDGADERDALGEGRQIFEQLCRITERYDVGVALMPLGFAWASVRTVKQALAVLEAVGRRSLGLALDTFHVHLGGSVVGELGACRPRALALVRLGDAPAGERESLQAAHRLPPGDGVAPLRAIVGSVRALAADAPLVVEAPMPRGAGDAGSWLRRLRERALAVARAPELASR